MRFVQSQDEYLEWCSRVESLVDGDARFPDKFLSPRLKYYSFIEFDDIFTESFYERLVDFIHRHDGEGEFSFGLMDIQEKELSEIKSTKYPVVKVDCASDQAEDYLEAISGQPWELLIWAGDFLVFSPSHSWVLYASRDFEIGVFAFEKQELKGKLEGCLSSKQLYDLDGVVYELLPHVYGRDLGVPASVTRRLRTNYSS